MVVCQSQWMKDEKQQLVANSVIAIWHIHARQILQPSVAGRTLIIIIEVNVYGSE